jgi:hypothetical protein
LTKEEDPRVQLFGMKGQPSKVEANQFRDPRSGGFKRETFGNKFYTPIFDWTLELLKLSTGVL